MKLLSLIAFFALLACTAISATPTVVIHPDYHLRPGVGPVDAHLKAGAYFSDSAGNRIKVDHVRIEVHIPFTKNDDPAPSPKGPFRHKQTYVDASGRIYCVPIHEEDNVREPDWSGNWHEAWDAGYFWYEVIATKGKQTFRQRFFVTRNEFLGKAEAAYKFVSKAASIAKVISGN